MGRELRRVPLDFAWPPKERWIGYLNPYRSIECKACDGSGLNPETKGLSDLWYDHEGFGSRWSYEYGTGRDGRPATQPPWRIVGDCRSWQHDLTQDEVDALIESHRLHDFTHDFVSGKGWVPKDPVPVVTPEMVNEWSHHGTGHDSINQWVCVKTRARRLGVYGECGVCHGEGRLWFSPEIKAASEAWERHDPPSGEGYQLWETTSEGSPVSPVFPSLDGLCDWAESNATTFGYATATAAEWRSMLGGGVVALRTGNAIFI